MKLKQMSLLTLLTGVLFSIIGVIIPFITLQNYIWPIIAILFGITLIVSALFCLIFSKTVKNNCNIKTTALSLGLSAVGAAGLACAFSWIIIDAFDEISMPPIEYPVSVLLGIIYFLGFIVLIALYLKIRKTNWSIKGFIIDVLTGTIYLPTFFFVLLYVLSYIIHLIK